MKTLLNMFKSMGKSQKRLLIVIGLFFVGCLIFVIVFGILNNRTLSYTQMEEKLLNGARSYYEDNQEFLPKQDGGKVSIDSSKLIELKYMKDFKKYNKNDSSCTGTVSVTNHRGEYLYIPLLKCSEYETNSLYNQILKEQSPVTEGEGLYVMNEDYVYRGEYPKNYVQFANQLWRIVRLTKEKEIRLIQVESPEVEANWDDRYNINVGYSAGITDFEISRIKDTLMDAYEDTFGEKDKSYIISKKLCIGSRNKKETTNDGSVECKKVTEEEYPVGMLQANEYLLASIDSNCQRQTNSSCMNYNYLSKLKNAFWSITTSDENTYEAYYFRNTVRPTEAIEFNAYRLVIHISGEVPFQSGDGTKANPYVIY